MYKKAFLILFLFISASAVSQNKTDTVIKQTQRLVYYVDETYNPGFLIPFIETYLKDLTYSDQNLQQVYSDVISLNMLFENRKIEGKLIDAFIFADRKQTNLENSKERDLRDNQIANYLLNYDKFLIIKIRPFNTLLEYQFLMYDVLKSSNENIKDSPVLTSYRSSSIFIDPKSTEYKKDLTYAIKQVCPEVNEVPIAEISVNSKNISSSIDTLFLPTGDTIKIKGIAIDPDSPKERFTYSWSVSENILYGQIIFGKETQTIVLDTPLVFTASLIISDGINQSKRSDVVISVIKRPEINIYAAGNVSFLPEEYELFSNNLTHIQDDFNKDENYKYDYLYRKNIFGKKSFLFGEDSLTIYLSKGTLRLSNTSVTDSILPSTFTIHELIKDTIIADTLSSISPKLKKAGKYILMKLYPEKMLRPGEYHYTFYANYKGVKSKNLNLDINFIKVSQISLLNEYSYTWLGGKKGSMGLAFLGIGWQPFSFSRLTLAGAYPIFSSEKVKNNIEDKIATRDLSIRISIEFFKSTEKNIYSYSIQMHRFPIINAKGEKSYDNIWGVGLKTSFPLLLLGSSISPVFSYNFFPNFSNKSYVSGIGIFEFTMGIKYFFLKRK